MYRLAIFCVMIAKVLAVSEVAANAAPIPPASPSSAIAPQPTPTLVPLTEAQLKDPTAALAASRKTVGDGWGRFGCLYVSGVAQIQNQPLPFTYAADLRTGYNRTIILLPRNAGTLEYGVDKSGGWSAVGGYVRPVAGTPQSIASALYVARFGFFNFPSDAAALKEIGSDEKIGDRMSVTPTGGVPILAIVKPSTSLVSAVQFGNGQVTIYGDYRRVNGVLYPFRTLQGKDANALSVFQASSVMLTAEAPGAGAVDRPALPVATPVPQASPTTSPAK
jgi:hypothetical protein